MWVVQSLLTRLAATMFRYLVPEAVYTVKRVDVLPTTCALVG
jgi:hypothetical protein